MSNAKICDNCHLTVPVDSHGEDEDGEIYAWIRVSTLDGVVHAEACCRACARGLLDDESLLARIVDARLEGIVDVVRTLRGDAPSE